VRVLLLAGEPSGDRYAAGIARALREKVPGADIRGMGGQLSREAGVSLIVDSTELAVVGLTEVLSKLPALLRARFRLRQAIERWRPDVVIPVDYPEFNLKIAGFAKEQGSRVAWFISPQAWAWRSGRVPGIGRRISKMLVIFPFECALYEQHGIPVEHVGHPLMDFRDELPTRGTARAAFGIGDDAPVIGLLPGSRRSELKRTWPVLCETARRLVAERPALRFLLPLAPGIEASFLQSLASVEGLPIALAPGGMANVLAAADTAIIASGTATLEAALAELPFVTGYRVSLPTALITARLIEPEFRRRGLYTLPNLILGKEVLPELYQRRFRPEVLMRETLSLLEDERRRQEVLTELRRIPALLGGPGTLARVADAALELGKLR
jgi:lipid-A-disaccharide synthase